LKILIVDDECELVFLIKDIVESMAPQYTTILTANSSNEAIEILRNNTDTELAISDHNMPGGSGDLILKHLMEHSPSTRFVLCTTISHQEMSQNIHVMPYFSA
jgi:CheY-like chemotaxis protein